MHLFLTHLVETGDLQPLGYGGITFQTAMTGRMLTVMASEVDRFRGPMVEVSPAYSGVLVGMPTRPSNPRNFWKPSGEPVGVFQVPDQPRLWVVEISQAQPADAVASVVAKVDALVANGTSADAVAMMTGLSGVTVTET